MDEITKIVFGRIPIVDNFELHDGLTGSNPFILGKLSISISTVYGQLIIGVIGFCLLSAGFYIELKNYKTSSGNGDYINTRERIHLIDDFPKSLVKEFESSSEVWIFGASLSQSLQYPLIEQKLKVGHKLKILIIDPESRAIEMAECRVYGIQNINKRKNTNFDVLSQLCDLKKRYPTQIEIKVIDFLLPYRVIAINPSTDKGILYIHHYAYKSETNKIPKFILNSNNGRWFNFYLAEVRNYWKDGIYWNEKLL